MKGLTKKLLLKQFGTQKHDRDTFDGHCKTCGDYEFAHCTQYCWQAKGLEKLKKTYFEEENI